MAIIVRLHARTYPISIKIHGMCVQRFLIVGNYSRILLRPRRAIPLTDLRERAKVMEGPNIRRTRLVQSCVLEHGVRKNYSQPSLDFRMLITHGASIRIQVPAVTEDRVRLSYQVVWAQILARLAS